MYKKFKKCRKENLGTGTTLQNVKINTVEKTKTQSNSSQDLICEIEMIMRKEK